MAENEEYNSQYQIENDKSKWNLASDLKLLNTLKSTTEGITRQIENNANIFDDLTYKTNVCSDKINNLITNVLILTNSKFIENRVYEEDIKEIATFKQSTFKKEDASDSEYAIIERLKNSITIGINSLSQQSYNVIQSNGETFDRNVLLNSLYKNGFTCRALPFLIGSEEFTKDTFVGLKVENDSPPIIVLNNNTNNDDDDFKDMEPNYAANGIDRSNAADEANQSYLRESDSVPFGSFQASSQSSRNIDRDIASNESFINNSAAPSNLFTPDEEDEDDDIFTAKITSSRVKNNVTPRLSDNIDDNFIQDASPLEKPAINIENKKSTALPAKKDFFDFSSDEENDDDIFAKKNILPISNDNSKSFAIDNNLNESNSKNKSSAQSNDKKEIAITSKPIKTNKLESIFSSDDEDDDVDIFNVKAPKPQAQTKSIIKVPSASNKISAFSSSDDDDDDLFSQITKSKKATPQPLQSKTSISNKLTSIPVIISDEESQDPLAITPSTEKPSISNVPKSMSSISAKTPFMPNVISELSATLKNKVSLNESSSDDDFDNAIQAPKPAEPVAASRSLTVQSTPISISSISLENEPKITEQGDTFNDILKHKAKLNSTRKRRLPTRRSIKPSDDSLVSDKSPVEIVAPKPSALIDGNNASNENSKPQSSPPSLPSVSVTKPTITSEPSLFSSDDDDSDIFTTSNPSKPVVTTSPKAEQTLSLNPTPPPPADKSKPISLFDSSDESDSDIFSKPLPVKSATTSTSTNVGKAQTSAKIVLFDDSDEESFLPISTPKSAPVENTPTPNIKKNTQTGPLQKEIKKPGNENLKKSIFDDDSDDDLFKS